MHQGNPAPTGAVVEVVADDTAVGRHATGVNGRMPRSGKGVGVVVTHARIKHAAAARLAADALTSSMRKRIATHTVGPTSLRAGGV